ncbi:MAG: sensor histidine kinase, partial [Gemmatimonadaceae bacterium]
DYSVRGAGASEHDPLGMVMTEINDLSSTLQAQRLAATEATALLRTVMTEIDAAVFAFDAGGALRLVNRGGERLLSAPAERLLGKRVDSLGLGGFLRGDAPRTAALALPGGGGRWEVRRTSFRQDGQPHTLLVLTDVSHALREEERLAWQRLVRVLSHEINNSLTPIRSISRSLRRLVVREPRPADVDDELRHGLTVIEGRAGALVRFLQAYARLARLPKPTPRPMRVDEWVHHVASLEKRIAVGVRDGPPLVIHADRDQLEQLLINLVGNAADAAIETGGAVTIAWSSDDAHLHLEVVDEGPGLADTANLFVPFFTTKPDGSGIGLVLSRQIAEAHGGTVTLENREGRGCVAKLRIPI